VEGEFRFEWPQNGQLDDVNCAALCTATITRFGPDSDPEAFRVANPLAIFRFRRVDSGG